MSKTETMQFVQNEIENQIVKFMQMGELSEDEMIFVVQGAMNTLYKMALTRRAFNNIPINKKGDTDDGNTNA